MNWRSLKNIGLAGAVLFYEIYMLLFGVSDVMAIPGASAPSHVLFTKVILTLMVTAPAILLWLVLRFDAIDREQEKTYNAITRLEEALQ